MTQRASRLAVGGVVALAVNTSAACSRPLKDHPAITRYSNASCILAVAQEGGGWEWSRTVERPRGVSLLIHAFHGPGGRVDVTDQQSGASWVAASSGDYVYPADLRLDAASTMLYVKTDGVAGGLWRETWLFQYDLSSRRQVLRIRVDPNALPPECPLERAASR
jgi:hypothetical protein